MNDAELEHTIQAIDIELESLHYQLEEAVGTLHHFEIKAKQLEASMYNLQKQRRELLA